MYFITTKRMLEVCFSAHPNIQYRTQIRCHILSGPDTRCCQGLMHSGTGLRAGTDIILSSQNQEMIV